MSIKSPGKPSAFTLIEIVVVVAIIGMMLLIVIPMVTVGRKRSKAQSVFDDLKTLNAAVQQYAVDTGRGPGFNPVFQDLRKYLDKKSYVYRSGGRDLRGNVYGPFSVDTPPKVPEKTYLYFSGVVDDAYWSVYH
jgi:prepilin-type N-terminal cleavage/methylation domain-containing protein